MSSPFTRRMARRERKIKTANAMDLRSNLMAPDDFKNLGFADSDKVEPIPSHAGGATAHKVRDDGKKIT